jgi:hypothetical protein
VNLYAGNAKVIIIILLFIFNFSMTEMI